MQRFKRNKVKTVSEKVSELIAKADGFQSEESEDETAPKITEFDEDEYALPDGRSTDIRKRNVKLLSEQSAKYRGKIASRKDLEMDDEEDEDEESDDNEEAFKSFGAHLRNGQQHSEDEDSEEANYGKTLSNGHQMQDSEEDDSEDDDDEEALRAFDQGLQDVSMAAENTEKSDENDSDNNESQEDDSENEYEEDDSENGNDEDLSEEDNEKQHIISESNCQAEIQKGQCVQNQLRIWERLLELRINSQKLITKANQLPMPTEMQEAQKDSLELQKLSQESTQNLAKLFNSLVQLQFNLSSQCSEVKEALTTLNLKRAGNFETDQPPFKRMATQMDSHFKVFKNYRNSVLLKWDDRTKLLTPGAGAKKKSLNEEFDIIKKIDNTLINQTALLEKSRTLKNGAPSEGVAGTVNAPDAIPNPEIYDDADFYHQQLRELIEYKANTASSLSEVTKQYVELQQLRQRMKKKVDTRASKGRKLRYTVHNKLVNFMAPNGMDITWTEESTNELCKSLFAA